MMGLEDIEFRAYYDQALQLDWTGLDLWAVGGIVSGWQTADIDSVILGEADEARIAKLIQDLRMIGPWSTTYGANIVYDFNYTKRVKVKTGYAHGSEPRIEWKWDKWPKTKHLARRQQGILNGEPVQLIQNGTQIYL